MYTALLKEVCPEWREFYEKNEDLLPQCMGGDCEHQKYEAVKARPHCTVLWPVPYSVGYGTTQYGAWYAGVGMVGVRYGRSQRGTATVTILTAKYINSLLHSRKSVEMVARRFESFAADSVAREGRLPSTYGEPKATLFAPLLEFGSFDVSIAIFAFVAFFYVST